MSATPEPARTRRWTLVRPSGALDVEVSAADGACLGTVLEALAPVVDSSEPRLYSGSTPLDAATELGSAALAHGAVLGLDRPGPRARPAAAASALSLEVVGGPDAGLSVPLHGGQRVVGRGGGADVSLDDPGVSRRHLVVEVGGGRVTVRDAGSANGSRLDGGVLGAEPTEWSEGAVLRIGASALTVRGPGGVRLADRPAPGGRTLVHPVAARRPPRQEVEVRFPAEPAEPARRRLAWVAIAVPAAAGALAAWWFASPTFLFFALLSPVVALGSWLGDRWSGRRTSRRDAAAHAEQVAEARSRLSEAVRAERRAAEADPPDLGRLTAAARRRAAPLWTRRREDPDALVVRLGRGPGATRVVRIEPDGSRTPEPCGDLPVCVDLAATGGLAVVAPRRPALGVVAAVLAQTCALLPAADLGVAVLTTPDGLPDWAWSRWLPHVDPADVRVALSGEIDERPDLSWLDAAIGRRSHATVASGHGRAGGTVPPWLVVVLDRPPGPQLAAALRRARANGVVTLTTAGPTRERPAAVLHVTGETGQARLEVTGSPARELVVDQLSRPAAVTLARDLAPLGTAATGAEDLPATVRLLDLLPAGLRVRPGADPADGWSRRRDDLVAVLGASAEGAVAVDLCRDGPHALVAGTTGAGKSELLQSLIAGLALAHPPDRCSFLLVDYKGGAAFAEAAELPHTVGVVTDLDARTTARALRSLGAELARREAVLAAAGVADVAALPEDVDLARLVIVVDEFAGLVEEFPDFVPGLVAIAQRGRSLGVHLVLATQRPAGVVSPEIRANCSLRLCLRTTDESDSRDVLGTGAAAALPVDRPGRAYLRIGAAAPVLVQVARVAGRAPHAPDRPRVRRWEWPRAASRGPARAAGRTDLAAVTAALRRRAERAGERRPHRPWCPPLPDRLAAADLAVPSAAAGTGPVLAVGLVDRPDTQGQEVLTVDLGRGGGWLVVGGPGSGRSTFLRTVLAEAVGAAPPDELHVHVLDHGGGALAAAAAGLPHTGTAVGADDPLRTTRLVDRLAAEVAARRASGRSTPRLLLLADGLESLSAQLDEADPTRGSAALLRLVRDGGAAGLTCLLTADRAVPGSRPAAAVGTRLVLPMPDRADYGVAGIPARAVPGHRPPGRALVGEATWECQLALPRALPRAAQPTGPGPAGPRPASAALRIPDLEPDPRLPLPVGGDPGEALRAVPLGPGGDEGDVLLVDLLRAGGLLVAGPPGSGRSATLDAVTAHLLAADVPVLRVTGRRAGAGCASPAGVTVVEATDTEGWAAWTSHLAGRPGVVTVDDHADVAEAPVVAALGASPPDGVVTVVAGSAADLSTVFRGPVAALRRRRSGLLLCPGPGDADLLGIRLPRTPVPARPGSGWLVDAGVPRRVQVAARRVRGEQP
ncbi:MULTISPECIES: FtsK/SpoIIIE domain-containing protein [unclassified Blastococcus]